MVRGKKLGIGFGIAFAGFIVLIAIAAPVLPVPENVSETISKGDVMVASEEPHLFDGGLGSTAIADELAFTLTYTAQRSIIFGETADGQFIIVSLDVRNDGGSPADAGDLVYMLVDKQHRSFTSSTVGAAYDDWLEESKDLNPGLTRTGTLVFDVTENSDAREYTLQIFRGPNDQSPLASLSFS
jgi:hypothetical protein